VNSTARNLDRVVREIADKMRQRTGRGEVATYIPELARVDPKAFGIAVVDVDGKVAASGDSETPFSIQSISKIFTLTLALGRSAIGYGGALVASLPAARSTPLSSSNASRGGCRATPSSIPARLPSLT
jgi:glutaminase